MRRPLAVTVLAALLAACGGAASSSPAPSLAVHGGAASEGFRLVFDVPRATWSSGESIAGTATLSYAGPGSTTIGAAIQGPIMFGVTEVGGSRQIVPASDAVCAPHPIAVGEPISTALYKSGGYDPSDPVGFAARFFQDPGFRLPAGTWEITAYASFNTKQDCDGGTQRQLTATVRIRVGD